MYVLRLTLSYLDGFPELFEKTYRMLETLFQGRARTVCAEGSTVVILYPYRILDEELLLHHLSYVIEDQGCLERQDFQIEGRKILRNEGEDTEDILVDMHGK